MRIYVGNLPYTITDEELRQLFEPHGAVDSASVATDRDTGRSRGFGFVDMPDETEARQAIEAMNETEFGGRTLVVNEARPRPQSGAVVVADAGKSVV